LRTTASSSGEAIIGIATLSILKTAVEEVEEVEEVVVVAEVKS
jgi:hypothetical protein